MTSICFYDFEVFRHDWLVVIVNPYEQTETVIINDADELSKFHAAHRNDIYVGFNSSNYDQYIYNAILCGLDPYKLSNWIINEKKPPWKFSRELNKPRINNFDCMIGYHGLKTLEAFMGESIYESSVPFDIDRKLTEHELAETVDYCRADVWNTMKVFASRIGEFNGYLSLIKMYGLPLSSLNKTKAQLVADILNAHKSPHNDEFDIQFPPTLSVNKYTEVLDFYSQNWNYDKESIWVNVCGVWHSFGTGGVHGAEGTVLKTNKNSGKLEVDKKASHPITVEGNILHIDVVSYYPSLNIEYPEITLSRNIPNPSKVREMRDLRVGFKKSGRVDEAYGLKIAINAIGGATKLSTSKLYDPRQNNNMCIAGQLFLLDLLEKLEGKCRLLQSNTDGLFLQHFGNRDEIIEICKAWENRTRMKLEYEDCSKLIQGDVNNYIVVAESGKVEAKGAYVKDLDLLDYNLAIVNRAVREALINGTPVENTVLSCNTLNDFQMVVKLASNYTKVFHNGEFQDGKTFRVFASLDDNDTSIGRVRMIGDNPAKFANTPEHCFIDNSKIIGKEIPQKLDKSWYIAEAKKRLKEKFGVII